MQIYYIQYVENEDLESTFLNKFSVSFWGWPRVTGLGKGEKHSET